jgi:hypothetical protein
MYGCKYEPTTKNNLGVDCISRADAIHAVSEALERAFVEHEDIANKLIGKLPAVTSQEPKTGHWIDITNKNKTVIAVRCSCCEKSPKYAIKSDFCPNCGADMREIEDKE